MEGTRSPGSSGPIAAWRIAAGIGVLVLLAAIAVLLVPPYFDNWKLESYLAVLSRDAAARSHPVDLVRALVVDDAAWMGLPVHLDDVHVTPDRGRFKIEVLYVVHIDLPVYTVDLHFRPGAG